MQLPLRQTVSPQLCEQRSRQTENADVLHLGPRRELRIQWANAAVSPAFDTYSRAVVTLKLWCPADMSHPLYSQAFGPFHPKSSRRATFH